MILEWLVTQEVKLNKSQKDLIICFTRRFLSPLYLEVQMVLQQEWLLSIHSVMLHGTVTAQV